jgi:predicted phage-related endonuclease
MVHGQNLELYVAQCYSRLTGRKLHKSRFCRDKHVPYFAVNPDYETRGERPVRLVECKTAGAFMKDEWGEEGDAVPDQYLLQCMWQLAITGKQIVDLAVLIGGQDLRIYTIERDEDLIAHIRSEAMNWWETYMLSQTPPPISGMKPDTEYVNSEFSNSIEQVVYADPELDDLCIALRDARLAVNQADEYKTKLENDIKLRMKEASVLESSVGKITWKNTANGGSRRFVPKFKEVSTICPQPVAA